MSVLPTNLSCDSIEIVACDIDLEMGHSVQSVSGGFDPWDTTMGALSICWAKWGLTILASASAGARLQWAAFGG